MVGPCTSFFPSVSIASFVGPRSFGFLLLLLFFSAPRSRLIVSASFALRITSYVIRPWRSRSFQRTVARIVGTYSANNVNFHRRSGPLLTVKLKGKKRERGHSTRRVPCPGISLHPAEPRAIARNLSIDKHATDGHKGGILAREVLIGESAADGPCLVCTDLIWFVFPLPVTRDPWATQHTHRPGLPLKENPLH